MRPDRRARRPEDLQPLPERLGDGLQHAVQDVEALRVQRRHVRPLHHLLAGRDEGAGRDPRPVPPRHRHRSDHPRRPRRRSPRDDQGPRAELASTASACGPASTMPPRRQGRPSSTRCSARERSGTTAGRPSPHHPTIAGWGHFNDDEWELYHTDVDRSELRNLAAEHPEKVRELVNLWYAEAGANGGVPARRPLGARDHAHSATGALAAPQPLRLFPRDGRRSRVAGSQRPQPLVRDRRAGRHSRPLAREGVLFAHGSRFGGHALYVKDNRLHYIYNFVGHDRTEDRRDGGPPGGDNLILSASFDKAGEDPPGVADGNLSLWHGDPKVGEGQIKTQPGKFMIAGEGLCIGRRRRRRPSPTTTRAARPTASPAAPSTASRSTSAASRTSTSSARPAMLMRE